MPGTVLRPSVMVTRVQRGKERIEELKKKKTKDRERRTLVG